MGKYLVTGRSATGKTTIWKELLARGYTAFDGDKVRGLAGWVDLSTGHRIREHYPGDNHLGKFTWDWDEKVLHKLLGENEDMFLCGNADNATRFYQLFTKVFILTLPAEIQRQRIYERTEHDYGKHPVVQQEVISGQQVLVAKALSMGAIAIDATPPASEIVNVLLSQTL